MRQEVYIKLAETIGRLRQVKQAEAAYAEGFAKAAELAGADPVELFKQADGLQTITSPGVNARRSIGFINGRRAYETVGNGLISRILRPNLFSTNAVPTLATNASPRSVGIGYIKGRPAYRTRDGMVTQITDPLLFNENQEWLNRNGEPAPQRVSSPQAGAGVRVR